MAKKTALITGITGQDGSYLAELLLSKGYRVIGLWRKGTMIHPQNCGHLIGSIEFVYGDLIDSASLIKAIMQYQPDEIYNLGAQSYPGESWRLPIHTAEITGLGAHRMFEAVRQFKPDTRIYQASSSEMYGHPQQSPQDESTPFTPVNPYAASKLYAHNIARIFRQSFGTFVSCGILFNHESPRRGHHFITQKAAYGAACAKLGIRNSPAMNEEAEPIVHNGKLAVGNLDTGRDWGFAGDYVQAMWLMLQQPDPDDFVIATGRVWTIRELCRIAYEYVGLSWEDHITVDQRLVRPTETSPLIGNSTKAKNVLGWQPQTSFPQMIQMMVDENLKKLR